MKIRITIFLLLFMYLNLKGQNFYNYDSLNVGNIQSAVAYANQLYEKFNQNRAENPIIAKLYADSAINILDNNKLHKEAIDITAEVAVLLKNSSNYPEALSYSFKALKFYEQINDERKTGKMLNNIGSVNYYLKNDEKALEFYTKSLNIANKIQDEDLKRAVYNNISLVYTRKNDLDKALEYSKLSLRISLSQKDSINIAVCLTAIGDILFYKKDITESKRNYLTAYKIFSNKNKKSNVSILLNNLAEIEIELNNYNQALAYAMEAYKISSELQITDNLSWSAQLITKASVLTNNQKTALQYLDSLISKQEKLYAEENTRQTAQLQVLYETEKQKNIINSLEAQTLISNEKIKTNNIILIGVILLVIMVTIIAFLNYRNAKIKTKSNKELKERNFEIKRQKEEIEAINRQLEKYTQDLKELDEFKSRFFANISHELLTPLTLILGYTQSMIDSPKVGEDYHNQLLLITRQSSRLLKMIEQLLILAKIEQGKLKLRLIKDDFIPFLKTTVLCFQSAAEEKHIEIITNLHADTLTMNYDKEKCETILYNLLSNAIKYTEANGVITVETKINENELTVSVSDTGIGISEKQISDIFNYFYRSPDAKIIDGHGIGLSITKELIKIHKANIHVESVPGKGSCFSIVLALDENHYSDDDFEILENANVIDTNKNSDLSKTIGNSSIFDNSKDLPLLLLVEDNSDMRDYIYSSLNNYFNIKIAENGQKGIDIAFDLFPDLIISDVMMPEKDGKELTKTLKNDPRTSHIPIILLTVLASIENKIEGLETSADDYITKPFNIKELITRINNLLLQRQLLREKYEKRITVNPSDVTVCSIDEKFLARALSIVEKHIMDSDLDVELLCKELGMSRPTLHRKLKSLTGQSATEFIRVIRLKRAASLLQQNTGNVSEIAYTVGFNSLSYFTKSFKEYFGVAPSEYSYNEIIEK